MKRSIRAVTTTLAFALAAACGGGGGGGGGGSGSLAAAWRYVSGPAFGEDDFDGELRYLVLQSDGRMSLHYQEPGSGTVLCHDGVYARTSDGLVTQVGGEFELVTTVFLREQPDGSTLELTDAAGGVSVFDREASLPTELDCRALTVRAVHPDLLPVPTFFTGLAYDGTRLWFTDESEVDVYPVDPLTGAVGVPIEYDNSQFQMVHAAQGTDFWTHCRCGGSQEAQRRTQADAFVDEVNTESDLANEISVRAIAYDPLAAVLWLHGQNDVGVHQFLQVSSDVEPDVLVSTTDFDVDFRSTAWDGTHMWGLTSSQNLVQVDMTTFQAVATYDSPDVDVEWVGIASAPASFGGGNSLYLIGRDLATGDGVLIEVQP